MISTSPEMKDLDSPTRVRAVFSTYRTVNSRESTSSGPMFVEAGNDIPAGLSVNLGASDIVLGHSLLEDKRHSKKVAASSTYVCVKVYWRNGQLEGNEEGSVLVSWVQIMRCARDRHEQNVELVRKDAVLHACTVRKVVQGEELLVWYGEGLARDVGVPILTPCHIRGHQEYVCSGCQAHFTHPNTLKAHMFLQCKRSFVLPSADSRSLVPFHRLLQTLNRPLSNSANSFDKEKSLRAGSRLKMASSSGTSSGCGDLDEESLHRSAFRAPSTSRDLKREMSSDDGLMTPDSSTDQSSALNLSIKLVESCSAAENVNEIPLHAIHPWNSLTAQQMMAQSISIPFDYSPLAGCYTVSPHLHTFGIHFMKSGHTTLPHGHSYVTSLDRPMCSNMEYSLLSPHMDNAQEHLGISTYKSHPTSTPSLIRQARQTNSYGFALPSDKEPLDLLPQAYFANKSNKGHMCLCCGKLYSRKYGLKIHMRTHNGYKPLKCKICSRPFGDPSNLNKHVRLHAQGDTPYRCEFCGKVLVRRRDLERHVRSRHPMGCVQNDDTIGVCEASPDSSSISVESSESTLPHKEPSYNNC